MLLLFLFLALEGAVDSGSGPDCFVDEAYPLSSILVFPNIAYGSAFNNYTRAQETLLLDVYAPPLSDKRLKRPAVVLVHGGAFVSGTKTSDGEPDLAYTLASRGYVVVSINYRLTGKYWGAIYPKGECCPGTNSDQYARDATEDLKAAVRFLRKVSGSPQWRLDPDRIAVAGDSAGAVTVLYTGYVQIGEGTSGNPGFSSSVRVVVPISGELKYDAFCTTVTPTPQGCHYGVWNRIDDVRDPKTQPPLIMVHGTNDTVVPYREALSIQSRANEVGLTNRLITIPGAGHVPIKQLLETESYLKTLLEFLFDHMDLARSVCPLQG